MIVLIPDHCLSIYFVSLGCSTNLKDENEKKCITMGIIVLKLSFGEVNTLSRLCKTKFANMKSTIYL